LNWSIPQNPKAETATMAGMRKCRLTSGRSPNIFGWQSTAISHSFAATIEAQHTYEKISG
jgi:hypothetical protein